MKKGYRQLLDEANALVTTVPADAAIGLHGMPEVVFVDLRDPREIARDGRIPDAFHCPRGMLEFWIDPESPYHKPIFAEPKRFVFCCASGWRSALSARTAMEMGLDNIAHLEDGFTKWRETDGPVEIPEKKTS